MPELNELRAVTPGCPCIICGGETGCFRFAVGIVCCSRLCTSARYGGSHAAVCGFGVWDLASIPAGEPPRLGDVRKAIQDRERNAGGTLF